MSFQYEFSQFPLLTVVSFNLDCVWKFHMEIIKRRKKGKVTFNKKKSKIFSHFNLIHTAGELC